MELTVGYLKKVLDKLDDKIVLAHLDIGNDRFEPFEHEKRLLLLEDVSINKSWGGKTYLVINGQGSHFTGEGEQAPLKYTGVYFDEDTFKENKK